VNDRPSRLAGDPLLERISMKSLVPLLVLLVLAGCQSPPRTALSPQEQQARDAEHDAVRQERAQQELWEWDRGQP
jgi:hypothetical protein